LIEARGSILICKMALEAASVTRSSRMNNKQRMTLKIAIIGSGAAAVGVLRAIEEWRPQAEVTVFDQAEDPTGPFFTDQEPAHRSSAYHRDLYRHMRRTIGLKFPPPKTNFGLEPAKRRIPDWGNVWESGMRGGLTNFWGASSLPFTDDDLHGWPIKAADLSPYYSRIAEMIGISGGYDPLGTYLGNDFVNRPPITRPPVFDKLQNAINDPAAAMPFRVAAGTGRLALETRKDRSNRCIYSGACMTGCSSDSIYSARRDIERYARSGLIQSFIRGTVLAVHSNPLRLKVKTESGEQEHGPFDRVFTCAGCIGSTEIVMRSLGLRSGPLVTDNSVYTFPIIYTGLPLKQPQDDQHFAMTNLLAYCIPGHMDGRVAMIQVYPSIDFLWRYYFPVWFWPLFQPIGNLLRRRVLWGRVFLHGDYSQQYALKLLESDQLALSLTRRPKALTEVPGLWRSIRKTIGRKGFFIPPLAKIRHATSSHYAGSLPLGEGPIGVNGAFLPGAYICDSAGFTNAPAPSLTFTIMANACRIAHGALQY